MRCRGRWGDGSTAQAYQNAGSGLNKQAQDSAFHINMACPAFPAGDAVDTTPIKTSASMTPSVGSSARAGWRYNGGFDVAAALLAVLLAAAAQL